MRNRRRRIIGLLTLATVVALFSGCKNKGAAALDTEISSAAAETDAEGAKELLTEGGAFLNEEDYEQAVDVLLKSLDLDSSNTETYRELSKAYFGLGEYEKMEQILAQGYETTKDESLEKERISSLETVSRLCMEDEDYENAVVWITKLMAETGETSDLLYSLGNAYSMLEEYDKAVETLEKADGADEKVKAALVEAKIRYGEQCYEEGNYEEAASQLKLAMEMDPDAIEAYTLLLSVYIDDAKFDEAGTIVKNGMKQFLESGKKDLGDQLDGFLNMASSYYSEREDMIGGLNFWQKVVSIMPDHEAYREELSGYQSLAADEAYIKGEELLTAGNANGASAYYKQAFSLAPGNFEAGVIYLDTGSYCLNSDGSWKVGWYEDETGAKYYFNPAGGANYAKAVTGWQTIDGTEYYFQEDGMMLVDDTAPDGRYVGMDGKVTENPDQEEETEPETEETADPEEETSGSDSADSETGGGPGGGSGESSGVQIVRPQETSGSGSVSTTGALRLNADTLQAAMDKGGAVTLSKSELFYGGGSVDFTLDAIYSCLDQYNIRAEWVSLQDPYEISVGNMTLKIMPGDDWGEETDSRSTGTHAQELLEREIPDTAQFTLEFTNESGKTKVNIDKIRKLNG